MSVPLRPLPHPDLDPLKTGEVAAALGMRPSSITRYADAGRFVGAFQTPGEGNGPGHWRYPRAAVVAVGKELGVWDE